MPNRAFEDFTESEILEFVERFAAKNGFERADGAAGEWTSNSKGGGLKCRMKEADDEKTKEGPKHSATAYLHLDAPQNCVIYSHRRGKLTWRIQDEQKQSPEAFQAGGPSFAGEYHKPTPEEEEQRTREREAKRAAEAEAAERRFQEDRAAALRSYEQDANDYAPAWSIGPGVEYLKSKDVTAAPGVRLSWKQAKIFPPGALVVPFFDVLSGDFVTFQRIIPGVKGYASGFGGRAAAFWIIIQGAHEWTGEVQFAAAAPKGAPLVILCEGYATGATCAELFGLPVGITGDAGKLVNVARSILSAPAWERTRLIIAADDDYLKTLEGKANTGKDAAINIFNLDRARVYPAPPPWDWKGRDMEAARANPARARSDWNDFAAIYPGEAQGAAKAIKAAAVEYFQRRQ